MSSSASAPLKKANRRRQVYIPGSFQRQFVLQFCGIVLLGCMLFGMVLYLYSSRTLTTAFVRSRLHVMSTADFLLPALGFTAVVVTALAALVAAGRVLVLSHRIAGPLYRLEKATRAMGQGDLSFRVQLRDRDELQGFAQAVDGTVAELRRQLQAVGSCSEKVRAVVAEIQHSPSVPGKLVQELEDAQRKMEEALARFRL